MNNFKKLALAATVSSLFTVAGCGGGGGSSSGGSAPAETITIRGLAEAPAGTVAHLEPKNLFEVVTNFLVAPVAAAITGLEPVQGATVELIRIDDDGKQVGNVLATTVTSITGDYQLTLPRGVDLSGALIVRITGTNDASMSAQVVEKTVNINPVSEFVLRKFIEQGVDLDQLVVTDVVKLSGKVEEFDLTAGTDLSAMLKKLEEEVGEFVENQIEIVKTTPGNVSSVAGAYRSSAYSVALHDSDNLGYGSLWSEVWASDFTFADGGNGKVQVTHSYEESSDVGLNGITVADAGLWFDTGIETESETLLATLTSNGVLAIEGEFEEEVEEDFGWRFPATVYNLQKVKNRGLFALLSQEASVRYGTTDTGALNPNDRQGDEVARTLEFFARKPSGMQASDLKGDFGRVYFESHLATGQVELRAETTRLTFNGDGTFQHSATPIHSLVLTSTGTTYDAFEEGGSTEPQPVKVTADGDIQELGSDDGVPSPADGFINDTFDFISLVSAEGTGGSYGTIGKTLMVKLPSTAPQLTGKTYRLMFLGMHLSGAATGTSRFLLSASQFNTFVTMNSQTSATLTGKFSTVAKEGGLGANNAVTREDANESGLVVGVQNNGATTITIPSGDDATILEGFFNADATLGIFTERYQTSEGDVDDLGLAILVEVAR